MLYNPLDVNFKCPILQVTCIFVGLRIRFVVFFPPREVLSSGLVLVFGEARLSWLQASSLSVERWESVP